jgi:hypothetical protein
VTITISAEDPRSIKAIEIAAAAGQWLKVRTADGQVAFGIPSQCDQADGRFYIVDGQSCDCEDFKRHGLSAERRGVERDHLACKHILAVRLHCELETAMRQRNQPRGRRGLTLLPSPVARLYDTLRED